jgi:hypothetical protein
VSRLRTVIFPRPIIPGAISQPRTRAKRVAIRVKMKMRVWWTINRSIDNCRMRDSLAENMRRPRHISSHHGHGTTLVLVRKRKLGILRLQLSNRNIETRKWVLLHTHKYFIYRALCHARDLAGRGTRRKANFKYAHSRSRNIWFYSF